MIKYSIGLITLTFLLSACVSNTQQDSKPQQQQRDTTQQQTVKLTPAQEQQRQKEIKREKELARKFAIAKKSSQKKKMQRIREQQVAQQKTKKKRAKQLAKQQKLAENQQQKLKRQKEKTIAKQMKLREKELAKQANSKKIKSNQITNKKTTFSKGTWRLSKSRNPFSKKKECMILSEKMFIRDPQGITNLQFIITKNYLYIKTDSNIDSSYQNIGLRVDNSKTIRFDKVIKRNSVRFNNFKKRHSTLLNNGRKVRVTLGFWPTWPKTRTRSTAISLSGYNAAESKFNHCLQNNRL